MQRQGTRFAFERRTGSRRKRENGWLTRAVLVISDSRWMTPAIAVYALFLCAIQLVSLRATPDVGEGLGYVCMAGANFAILVACALIAKRVSAPVRIRWRLMAVACGFGALGYLVAALGRLHFISFAVSTPNMTWLFDSREALLVLAVLRVTPKLNRLLALDIAQAMLFLLLRFGLTYAPGNASLSSTHLLVSMMVTIFFVLMAWTASWGATDDEEYWTLRIFTLIFAARFIQLFCGNFIGYFWLHHGHGSVWDVVGTAASLGLVVYLARRASSSVQDRNQVRRHKPSLVIRSLMPSFLAAGNILLALAALDKPRWYTACGVGLAAIGYGLRVAIVHQQTLAQSVNLQTRNEELERIAANDPLTKVGNRFSLSLAFSRMQKLQPNASFSFFITDADCFKLANDHLGHLHGDEVLVSIATVLHAVAALHPDSHCSRLGGDEFAVLLPNVDHLAAVRCAEQVRKSVEEMEMAAGDRIITLSIGVTAMPAAHSAELSTVLSQADIALYVAKSCGRNCVRFYDGVTVQEAGSTPAAVSTQTTPSPMLNALESTGFA